MKHTITLIAAILGACMNYVSYGQDTTSSNEAARALAQQIVQEAEKYLGTRYQSGGKGPDSFDCSGFTSFIYEKFGYTLSINSVTQATDGKAVQASASDGWKNMQAGDLVIFCGRSISKTPGHVGICTGPARKGSGFEFIHAASSGVRFSNIDEPYYAARILCVRRILPDYTGGTVESLESLEGLIIDDECRIVLLPDGKWKFQRRHDRKANSKLERRIILQPDGTWITMPVQDEIAGNSTGTDIEEDNENGNILKENENTVVKDDKAEKPKKSGKAKYHRIRKGDTLFSIARKNGTTVDAICKLNRISSNEILNIGQEIRVR